MIAATFQKFHQLMLYGLIGSLSASLDFIVFYLMTTSFSMYYLIANIFSVFIGISTSFILNRKFNFKVKDKTLKRFVIFLSVGLLGLLISSVLLFLFIDVLSLKKILSKLLSIVLVVLMQFVLNKYITFRKVI